MDLRGYTTVDEVGEDTQDEVPKYYQKTALAQMLVDKCKDIPLVGLQYVLEVRKDFNNTLDGCYYICAVCSKKMTAHTLVAHIKSMPHRLKFSETHCKHIFDKYSSYDIKEWTAPLVKTFTVDLAEVEKKMGRHKLAVAFEREISSVLKSLKQNISEISSLSRLQEEKTKVSEAPTPSKSTAPVTTTANSVQEIQHPNTDKSRNQNAGARASSSVNIPSKNQNAGAHAASNVNIPLPSKSAGPKTNTNNKNNDGYFENEEDEVLILPQEKKPANAKKFSSNGQGFTKRNYRPGPNFRRRSKSRSSTPSLSPIKTRSRSRSKSRSLSPKRNPLHSPPNKLRQTKPTETKPTETKSTETQFGETRLRQTSSTWSKEEALEVTRVSSSQSLKVPLKRHPQALQVKESLQIKAQITTTQKIVYEKAPETHPLYNREWKLFWERRCRELEKEGLDPFLYNFKREWAVYWHHRMKELIDQNFKEKRDALLKKFKIEDPDLEESELYDGSKPPGSLKKRDNDDVEKVMLDLTDLEKADLTGLENQDLMGQENQDMVGQETKGLAGLENEDLMDLENLDLMSQEGLDLTGPAKQDLMGRRIPILTEWEKRDLVDQENQDSVVQENPGMTCQDHQGLMDQEGSMGLMDLEDQGLTDKETQARSGVGVGIYLQVIPNMLVWQSMRVTFELRQIQQSQFESESCSLIISVM
ncbi:uncharacterized protein LOC127006001 [Eriocheir sinensis]|uniref:uncharacterized protein LOC127006001 n=1 Tax=Eriocheir sinensis TaxID=95602 RepID=UPI0021C8A735|nr:uncharacterized protein LOC127006001 [Eriocheir sinensis]